MTVSSGSFVLRCSWFNQNFSGSFFLPPVLAGEVALPVDDVQERFLDAEDIADVAVAALTEDGHIGREPRDFADYVRATAATGVWNGS